LPRSETIAGAAAFPRVLTHVQPLASTMLDPMMMIFAVCFLDPYRIR
jgi:hypothetical protein